MTDDNPTPGFSATVSSLTRMADRLIREEIALAKAEISEKITKLIGAAVIGLAAGIFIVLGLIYMLHAAAWGIWEGVTVAPAGWWRSVWVGFAIVGAVLFVFAAIAGFIAAKLVKKGLPPTPDMAIDEAQRIKESMSGAKDAITHPHKQKDEF